MERTDNTTVKKIFKALILDDRQDDTDNVKAKIAGVNAKSTDYEIVIVGTLVEHKAKMKSFRNYEYAAIELLNSIDVDLVFMDIHMDTNTTGYDILMAFQEQMPFNVIMITAHTDLVLSGFSNDVIGTLHKSSTVDQYLIYCNQFFHSQVKNFTETPLGSYFTLFEVNKSVKISTDRIVFIETHNKGACIHYLSQPEKMYNSKNEEIYIYRDLFTFSADSLLKLKSKLPNDMFEQVHRNLIVNVFHAGLVGFDKKGKPFVKLNCIDKTLNISRDGRQKLVKKMDNFKTKNILMFQSLISKYWQYHD